VTWSYYNEFDAKKAAWLRELIKRGVVAPGEVDERSILDVRPDDLRGFAQCHFFAGIGVWSYAMRLAGWSDDRPAWTGSCPCQPFAVGGKGLALKDERHLFPDWFPLISARLPLVVFGEQVSNGDGLAWLDVVRSSMDSAGYTLGVVDTCSASVGAPNIRQRLFFVADANEARLQGRGIRWDSAGERTIGSRGMDGELGYSDKAGRAPRHALSVTSKSRPEESVEPSVSGPCNGFWRNAEWIWCRDNKWRPTEPGSFPLVAGAPARVLRLRGYGDAINAQVAAAFIRAYIETRG
jgi:DNA (cytosine-5)-methyltransferase 1